MDKENLSAWMFRASVGAAIFGARQFVAILVTMVFTEPIAAFWGKHFVGLEALKNAVHAFSYRFDEEPPIT